MRSALKRRADVFRKELQAESSAGRTSRSGADDPMGGPPSITDRCPLPDPSIEEAVARIALLN
eukprot:1385516-Lingulodinium_polyedra.AAC.1